MILRKKYKVKGEDVDDFMVMNKAAYYSYIRSLVYNLLAEKGISKRSKDLIKIELSRSDGEIIKLQDLMFMQNFFLNLEVVTIPTDKKQIYVKSRFFDTNNELCAMVTSHFYWFDQYTEVVSISNKSVQDISA